MEMATIATIRINLRTVPHPPSATTREACKIIVAGQEARVKPLPGHAQRSRPAAWGYCVKETSRCWCSDGPAAHPTVDFAVPTTSQSPLAATWTLQVTGLTDGCKRRSKL